MRTRRFLAWSATIAGIATVASALAWPRAERVDVATVVSAPLAVYIEADARTRVRDRFAIVAPVSGQMDRVAVHVGDRVRAGDVVTRISPMPMDSVTLAGARARESAASAALDDAGARLRQATLASTLAARTAERYRALESVGGVSAQAREQTDLEAAARAEDLAAARARLRAAEADVVAARAALPDAWGRMSPVTVRAPIAGRVLAIGDESARIVIAGAPVLDLGRDRDLEIVIDVLSDEAVRIPPRAPVELAGWGGEPALHGVVDRIEPSARTRVSALGVEEQRVNVIASPLDTVVPLGDGFHADARIYIWRGSALQVPSAALYDVGREARLFVVEDGRARERRVSTGRRSDVDVEILRGVSEGERVILFPSDRIRDGLRVRPIDVRK